MIFEIANIKIDDIELNELNMDRIPRNWAFRNLLNISTLKARIGWQGLTTKEYLNVGSYYLVTGTDFSNGRINWETCFFVSKQRYDQDPNIQIKVDDILVTKDGTIGKIAYVSKLSLKATLNSGIFVIRPKDKSYIPLFVYYVFNSFYFTTFLKGLVAGSTINHLYQKDFISFTLPVPPIQEQLAIATALSDADALIISLEKLIEKKKKIKQGMMQELLRPKEGWVERRLGEVVELKKGQLITEKSCTVGPIPVIGGGIKPSYFHLIPNRGKNTITISASGANAGYVAYHLEPIFASDCTTIEENQEYDVRFFFYLLKIRQSEIFRMQTGGAQPHVYPEQLEMLRICFPNSVIEQQKIGTFFYGLDLEILAIEKKLAKLKWVKQGMTRELLTGKIRLV